MPDPTEPKYELKLKGQPSFADFSEVIVRKWCDHEPLWKGTLDELCDLVLEADGLRGRVAAMTKQFRRIEDALETATIAQVASEDNADALYEACTRMAEKLREAEAKLEQLRNLVEENIEHTADGVPVPLCEELFCPVCFSAVTQRFDLCYCETCEPGFPEDAWPVPRSYSSCFSTHEAAKLADTAKKSEK